MLKPRRSFLYTAQAERSDAIHLISKWIEIDFRLSFVMVKKNAFAFAFESGPKEILGWCVNLTTYYLTKQCARKTKKTK